MGAFNNGGVVQADTRNVPQWLVASCPGVPPAVGLLVRAYTESEARSLLRQYAGLSKLPRGTLLERVPFAQKEAS
ncbi:MAG TPA: hypothetical protein VFB66_20250 [Tepidisphaeraceae bacterium]|nr:hypothetical protein [Tepidisphaeraceae bacterium]